MKTLLILGVGTAGRLTADRLRKRLAADQWKITVVDQNPIHYYQPAFLFVPFGIYSEKEVILPRRRLIPPGVNYIEAKIDRIRAERGRVVLRSGEELPYDILIIATGAKTAPQQTKGMLGNDWHTRVFDFYTFGGASELYGALRDWNGGRLVIHITDLPIRCPVAPLEFALLADRWLTQQRLRSKTEIVCVTPPSSAFTQLIAASVLGHLLEEKRINMLTDFSIGRIDNDRHKMISRDGQEIDYDLLVTVPINMGDAAMARSGLGNELNFVPTNRYTLQSKQHLNIFVVGDATDLPVTKSSSVAQFQSQVLTRNILRHIGGEPLEPHFGGHAARLIECEEGTRLVPNHSNDSQLLEAKHLLPVLGPFALLPETRLNHFSQIAFRWIYGTCWAEACRWRELALR